LPESGFCAELLTAPVCSHTRGINRAGRLSRKSCAQSYTTTMNASASRCPSRFAILPMVKFQQRYKKRHGSLSKPLCAKVLCVGGTFRLSARFKWPISSEAGIPGRRCDQPSVRLRRPGQDHRRRYHEHGRRLKLKRPEFLLGLAAASQVTLLHLSTARQMA
jgi:hypothetical protein